MNVLVAVFSSLMILGLVACGGGASVAEPIRPVSVGTAVGSAGGGGVEVAATPDEQQLVPRFDCTSPAAEASAGSNTTVDGVWSGILIDCVSGTSVAARAFVQADGAFRIVLAQRTTTPDFLSNQLTGRLTVDGDLAVGVGTAFRAERWATSLEIDGIVEPGGYQQGQWDGRWRDGAGAYGYFALRKVDGGLHDPIRLQDWPARWELWLDCCELSVTWTIAEDGAITGDDDLGCVYAGRADAQAGRWFYPLALTVSGCLLEGAYSGALEPTSGPFNDQLFVYVDDGRDRAMRMHFLSWTDG